MKSEIVVRPLQQEDLPEADRVCRVAFGTFLGIPEPEKFFGDASYVKTRWLTNPRAAFAAEADGELVGSNLATNWGSVAFFGPLTIRPDFWDKGVGKRLMHPVMELFEEWKIEHAGLFTFAHSPKHVGLYQKFGFWPRFLTAILSKSVQSRSDVPDWTRFSIASSEEQEEILKFCRTLTDSIYRGLDVAHEIRAVADQKLGDTILAWDGSQLAGFAVCHCGPETEAGTGACYLKFGAARPGQQAEKDFNHLLDACEQMAWEQNLSRLLAGVNTGRCEAYRQLLSRGFRTDFQGVAMAKPNQAGYNRPDVYVVDDWR